MTSDEWHGQVEPLRPGFNPGLGLGLAMFIVHMPKLAYRIL